jgi:hypothetical protein
MSFFLLYKHPLREIFSTVEQIVTSAMSQYGIRLRKIPKKVRNIECHVVGVKVDKFCKPLVMGPWCQKLLRQRLLRQKLLKLKASQTKTFQN